MYKKRKWEWNHGRYVTMIKNICGNDIIETKRTRNKGERKRFYEFNEEYLNNLYNHQTYQNNKKVLSNFEYVTSRSQIEADNIAISIKPLYDNNGKLMVLQLPLTDRSQPIAKNIQIVWADDGADTQYNTSHNVGDNLGAGAAFDVVHKKL